MFLLLRHTPLHLLAGYSTRFFDPQVCFPWSPVKIVAQWLKPDGPPVGRPLYFIWGRACAQLLTPIGT
jgi:hypothetical protein